jgi:Tfp pilus assembly protein PilF
VADGAEQLLTNEPVVRAKPDRPRIETELARIEATPEFTRAPVMRRLLRFLVETTLTGGGNQLKAYSVAVDGLGRSPDFDAQSDSYPRVQVGRLRRMLQAFYAQYGVADGLRLSIPPGAYVVEFEGEAPGAAAIEAEPPARPPSRLRWALLASLLALLLVSGALALIGWRYWQAHQSTARRPADNLSQPPTMTVEIRSDANVRGGLAQATDAFLVDAIRRSRLVRLRQPDVEPDEEARGPADYRLTGIISGGPQPNLFVRLWRTDLDRLIWSGVVRLPGSAMGLQQALMPALVELGQPFGVIASDQRARHARDFAPGYACYLQYDLYRRDPDRVGHGEVSRCIDATLRADPRQAVALAAQSVLLVDDAQWFDGNGLDPATIRRAAALASRAVMVDPYSPDAHFAAARAALLQGACTRTRENGRRAIALDPYNPDLMARIGRYLSSCGDGGGEELMQRAIALDPNPPASFFTPLVLSALSRDDAAGAQAIAERMTPPGDVLADYYAFTLALVQAANGDAEGARKSWAEARGTTEADAETLLHKWQLTPAERVLALALLRDAGAIAPDAGEEGGSTAQPSDQTGTGPGQERRR